MIMNLVYLTTYDSDFVSVCTSAMNGGSRVRHGRPWGGVGILARRSLPIKLMSDER